MIFALHIFSEVANKANPLRDLHGIATGSCGRSDLSTIFPYPERMRELSHTFEKDRIPLRPVQGIPS